MLVHSLQTIKSVENFGTVGLLGASIPQKEEVVCKKFGILVSLMYVSLEYLLVYVAPRITGQKGCAVMMM